MRFWGFSAGGEKGVPSPFLSVPAPYATRPLIVTFVFQAGLRGNPLPGHLGCPRGSLCTQDPNVSCVVRQMSSRFPLFVRMCAFMFSRELCVRCCNQDMTIYSCLFVSLSASQTAGSSGSFFVSPGPNMSLAECLLKQLGFKIQTRFPGLHQNEKPLCIK